MFQCSYRVIETRVKFNLNWSARTAVKTRGVGESNVFTLFWNFPPNFTILFFQCKFDRNKQKLEEMFFSS